MYARLKSFALKGRTFYGVDLYSHTDGIGAYCITIRRIGDELKIREQRGYSSLETLLNELKPAIPVCLNIRTSDVIGKFVKSEPTSDRETRINHVFPNLDPALFFSEVYRLRRGHRVSIVKDSVLETIWTAFRAANSRIVHITLDVAPLSGLLDHLPDAELQAGNLILTPEEEGYHITQTDSENHRNYKLQDFIISGTFLLAFGAILSYLSPAPQTNPKLDAFRQEAAETHTYIRLFGLTGKALLIFLLILLSVNFLAYSHYFDSVGKLRILAQNQQELFVEAEALRSSVALKERRWEAVIEKGGVHLSKFLDELASHVPATILLQSLNYQPLAKQPRANKPLVIQTARIDISGITESGESYSLWVEELEKMDAVRYVETLDFDKAEGKHSVFNLSLHLHER